MTSIAELEREVKMLRGEVTKLTTTLALMNKNPEAETPPAKNPMENSIGAEAEKDILRIVDTILSEKIVGPHGGIIVPALTRAVRKSMNIFYGKRKLSAETQNVWDGLEAEERQKNIEMRKAVGERVNELHAIIGYIDKSAARGFSVNHVRENIYEAAVELNKLTIERAGDGI